MLPLLFLLLAQTSSFDSLPPDTVVMIIDGHKVTAAEIRHDLIGASPKFLVMFEQNPVKATQQLYMLRHLAAEGAAMKLDERSPLKEELETVRQEALFRARVAEETNIYPVSEKEANEYYAQHLSDFVQTKFKVILIRFAPPGMGGTSAQAVKEAAKRAMDPTQRTEAEAAALADSVLKKLKAGADFADAVLKYSEDPVSKANGGELPAMQQGSPLFAELQKAALSVPPGQTYSNVVRYQTGFFILR